MKCILRILGLICLVQSVSAQENALIYKSLNPGVIRAFKPFHDSSGYAASFYWLYQSGGSEMDIGVWSALPTIIPDTFTYDIHGTVLYNSIFQPQGMVYHYDNPDIYPFSGTKAILNFNYLSYQAGLSSFPTAPPMSNYPSSTFGKNIFIGFDALTETVQGRMDFSGILSFPFDTEPFEGYTSAIVSSGAGGHLETNISTVVGDSVLISFLQLQGQQKLNGAIEFNPINGQENSVRTKLNLFTGALSSNQIGSGSGSQTTLYVSGATSDESLYRVGIVRGENTPLSISGAQLSMPPNDSLYRAFITKESIDGQTEWLTQLYAYNNAEPDTLTLTSLNCVNDLYSIIENTNAVYVSNALRCKCYLTDTLTYTDFSGDTLYAEAMVPNYNFSTGRYNPYSTTRIFKIDSNGNLIGQLSLVKTIPPILGWFEGANPIFRVADKLAWVHNFFSESDTTIVFTYEDVNGNIESTPVEISGGKHLAVIWLNMDLNILDSWLIPFESDWVRNMEINYIGMYASDTLLIQGNIAPETTTSLDPFGATEPVYYDSARTFFAFYAAPEILHINESIGQRHKLFLFPNPVANEVYLSNPYLTNKPYRIFDISGRLIDSGVLNKNGRINTSLLNAGMYIIHIRSKSHTYSGKFMKN